MGEEPAIGVKNNSNIGVSQSAGIPTNINIDNNKNNLNKKNNFDLMWEEPPVLPSQNPNQNKGGCSKDSMSMDKMWGETPFDVENKDSSKNSNAADLCNFFSL